MQQDCMEGMQDKCRGTGAAGALQPPILIFIYVKEPREAGGWGKALGWQVVSVRPWAPGQNFTGARSGQMDGKWGGPQELWH